MATLRIEEGDDRAPFDVELDNQELGIGRGVSNALSFPNPWLSRFHAKIRQGSDSHILQDLASRNGTFLNGKVLHGESPLRHEDLITLGDLRLRYLSPGQAFRLADSAFSLEAGGTMVIGSEELLFQKYREPERQDATLSKGAVAQGASLLPALNAAASALIANYPMPELLTTILDLVQGAVPSERSALLLRQEGGEELEVKASRGLDHQSLVISRTLVEEVLGGNQAVLTLDARSDDRFEAAHSLLLAGIRSVICAPLWNNKEVIGLVYLDHRLGHQTFRREDLKLVGLLSNMAAVKIENARLLEEQIEKRRMEEQLALAARIQRKLLPDQDPEIPGYDIRGTSESCYEIGGDYYDFVAKKDGRLAVVIADISGKGIGAALLMAVLQASLRTLVHRAEEAAVLVAELNQVLVENSPSNKFATLFYGELDPRLNTFTYVNGGHNPVLLVRAGGSVEGQAREILELTSTGPLVGLIPNASFSSATVSLGAGDTLFLYTDGISEWTDAAGEELGTEGLAAFLRGETISDSRRLILRLRQHLTEFGGGGGLDDDSTVVVVRCLGD